MLYGMYTVWDEASSDSAPPFAAVNDAVAIRQVRKMFQENGPDFKLYKVGSYDTDHMTIEKNKDVDLILIPVPLEGGAK